MTHEVLLLGNTAVHSHSLVPVFPLDIGSTYTSKTEDCLVSIALTSCAGGVTNDVVAVAWMASMTSSMPTSFLAEPARSLKAYTQCEMHVAVRTGLGRE